MPTLRLRLRLAWRHPQHARACAAQPLYLFILPLSSLSCAAPSVQLLLVNAARLEDTSCSPTTEGGAAVPHPPAAALPTTPGHPQHHAAARSCFRPPRVPRPAGALAGYSPSTWRRSGSRDWRLRAGRTPQERARRRGAALVRRSRARRLALPSRAPSTPARPRPGCPKSNYPSWLARHLPCCISGTRCAGVERRCVGGASVRWRWRSGCAALGANARALPA